MTMPNVKKMFYILYVQRSKSASFLCFKMTLGFKKKKKKEYSLIIVFNPTEGHLTAFPQKQHKMNRSQCVLWGGQMAFLLYVYLLSGAME